MLEQSQTELKNKINPVGLKSRSVRMLNFYRKDVDFLNKGEGRTLISVLQGDIAHEFSRKRRGKIGRWWRGFGGSLTLRFSGSCRSRLLT